MEIDDYVRDSLMYHKPATEAADEFWWAPVIGGVEGYIIVWIDGSHHHTYRNPENL
jgi:hypothetical protein